MSTERGPPRRIFQSVGRFTREAKLRRRKANNTETSQFLAEIERLMDAKGIDDLEELHERFMEQQPERIGNAR